MCLIREESDVFVCIRLDRETSSMQSTKASRPVSNEIVPRDGAHTLGRTTKHLIHPATAPLSSRNIEITFNVMDSAPRRRVVFAGIVMVHAAVVEDDAIGRTEPCRLATRLMGCTTKNSRQFCGHHGVEATSLKTLISRSTPTRGHLGGCPFVPSHREFFMPPQVDADTRELYAPHRSSYPIEP